MKTVKKLIEELQECPQDSEIDIWTMDFAGCGLLIQAPCIKGEKTDNRETVTIYL